MSCFQTINPPSKDHQDINPKDKDSNQHITNSKLMSIYQSLKNYSKKYKTKGEVPEENFQRASSCVSSKVKCAFYYHDGEKQKRDLSQSQVVGNRKRIRRQKQCRSSEGKEITMPLEVQEKLKNRVTIHCLKAKRQEIQSQTKQFQSQYSFVMKKIEKLKKHQFYEDLKVKKLNQVKKQKRKMSEYLQKNREEYESQLKDNKEELRRNIMVHRSLKKSILLKKREENSNVASQQRLLSQENHQKIFQEYKEEYMKKKKKCLKEKKNYKLRRSVITSNIEEKKELAKTNFRMKWFNEFKSMEKAQQQSVVSKRNLRQKISNAYEMYNKLLDRHIKY